MSRKKEVVGSAVNRIESTHPVAAPASDTSERPYVVSRAPAIDPKKLSDAEVKANGTYRVLVDPNSLKPAGNYRVIHGRIVGMAGGEPGIPGDVMHFSAEEATRLLAQNVIEELDAKPSRVNRVWQPPTVIQNYAAAYG